MTDRKYTVAGTATGTDGVTKVRWTDNMVGRVKMMVKQGFTNINMLELPYPMTKAEGLEYLKTQDFRGEALAAIDFRIEEINEKLNYVPQKRGPKPKGKNISLTDIRSRKEKIASDHERA